MKLKLLVGALVLLIVMNLAAITAFLVVQTRHPRPPIELQQRGRGGSRGTSGLSREKRRAIMESMRSFHDQARPLIDETHALEDSTIAAMGETPVSRARIDSLLERISANRLELARRATDHMISMGESMTPLEREHVMRFLMRMRSPRGERAQHDGRHENRQPEEFDD